MFDSVHIQLQLSKHLRSGLSDHLLCLYLTSCFSDLSTSTAFLWIWSRDQYFRRGTDTFFLTESSMWNECAGLVLDFTSHFSMFFLIVGEEAQIPPVHPPWPEGRQRAPAPDGLFLREAPPAAAALLTAADSQSAAAALQLPHHPSCPSKVSHLSVCGSGREVRITAFHCLLWDLPSYYASNYPEFLSAAQPAFMSLWLPVSTELSVTTLAVFGCI